MKTMGKKEARPPSMADASMQFLLRLTGCICFAAFGGSGREKPQSACGLCAIFLCHIFAVAGNLRFPLSQPQKRHIHPDVIRHGANLNIIGI
jgi:hypothetical protein